MPRLLSCPQGHQWEAPEDSPSVNSLPCPVCGALGTNEHKPSTGAASSAETAPTLLEPGGGPAWFGTSSDQPPPNLPDFEILEELGRGGMGIVYKARRRSDGKIVAIKVIRKDRLQHEDIVRRFRREAQAASRLSDPNIVQVFDFDHAGETHYIVMEYVAGITLERCVEQLGPLPIPLACDFLRQAGLGLQHAHEQALVHRDIKPSNLMATPAPVLLTPSESGPIAHQVKLLDMGVARVLQLGGAAAGDSLSTITHGGAVIGTADYVAPEQLEDPHGADIRADLYSLGCTFYFLLTGQVPFPGGSLISKLDKQRWQTPTPIEELRPEVPPAVAAVARTLMAKKPGERFQTPGELANALTLLIQHGYQEPPVPRIEITEIQRLAGHLDAVSAVRWSLDGRHIASGGKDCLLLLWDAARGEVVRRFNKHPQEVRAVAFSPIEQQIATASGFTIRLWDMQTGQELRRFSGHSGAIKCLAFSADGKRLLSGSDDKSIRAWEVATGREVQRFRHAAGVTGLALVPEASQLVSASRAKIQLWDLRTDQEVRGFDSHAGAVLDIAVSADGKKLASAHFDTIVRLWDLETGSQLGTLTGHKQMVSALVFTPDGRHLLSAGQDHTLRLWDVATSAELACTSCHASGINALSFSPDGTRVVTAGTDKTLVISALPESLS